MREVFALVDVRVLDHLAIGGESFAKLGLV